MHYFGNYVDVLMFVCIDNFKYVVYTCFLSSNISMCLEACMQYLNEALIIFTI